MILLLDQDLFKNFSLFAMAVIKPAINLMQSSLVI